MTDAVIIANNERVNMLKNILKQLVFPMLAISLALYSHVLTNKTIHEAFACESHLKVLLSMLSFGLWTSFGLTLCFYDGLFSLVKEIFQHKELSNIKALGSFSELMLIFISAILVSAGTIILGLHVLP